MRFLRHMHKPHGKHHIAVNSAVSPLTKLTCCGRVIDEPFRCSIDPGALYMSSIVCQVCREAVEAWRRKDRVNA